jgi:AbrB family looped-hinge helix DNA binding protein
MLITSISEKGQVIIPDHICHAKNWKTGQKLLVTEVDGGILLKSASPFQPTVLDDVARCLPYHGTPKTLTEMDAAVAAAFSEDQNDCG